jgi:hypothetical protein
MGKAVIFDAHEYLPKQVLSKTYLPEAIRLTISKTLSLLEWFFARSFTTVIGATPCINSKFSQIGTRAVNINNYPFNGELEVDEGKFEKRDEVSFVGVMHSIRGISELIDAVEIVGKGKVNLIATFADDALEANVLKRPA